MRADEQTIPSSNGLKGTNGTTNGAHEIQYDLHSPHSNGDGVSLRPHHSHSWHGHGREEMTRILIQSLSDMGYHGAASQLSKESGYELEGPTVAAFRSAVLQGEWSEAEALLFGVDAPEADGADNGEGTWRLQGIKGLPLAETANKNEMLFALREQKYLELLEKRDLGSALMVLRQELTPLHQDTSRLHSLSSYMMSQSAEDLKSQAQWDGAAGDSRHDLLSDLSRSISPSVMIPEGRLANLLDQVKANWIDSCMFHNTTESPSLYVDHICEQDVFPQDLAHELHDHKDEVWHLAFSNNGQYLATASKDGKVHIYDLSGPIPNVNLVQTLDHDEAGVGYVNWSPDDKKIVTGSSRDNTGVARVWDVKSGDCLINMNHFDYSVVSAIWTPDGSSFILGSHDKKQSLIAYTMDENSPWSWNDEEQRVYDIALSSDGHRLVVLLKERILVFDWLTKAKIGDYPFDGVQLTSVSISQDCTRILVSMNPNRLCTIDLETGEMMYDFEGHKQANFMIKSAFGGADENFVVSGSEDSHVYVWRGNGHLVAKLPAHQGGCVNAVAWNPVDHQMFASAGDDHRVRIWTTLQHRLLSSAY